MKPCPQPPTPRRSFGGRTFGRIHGLRWSGGRHRRPGCPAPNIALDHPQRAEADLPTCRPADLPTCRSAVSGCLTSVTDPKFSPAFNSKAGDFAESFSLDHAGPPKAQHLSERLLRCYCSAQSSSILIFPLETAITTSSNQKRYET